MLDRPATNRKRHLNCKLFVTEAWNRRKKIICYFIKFWKEKQSLVRRSTPCRPCPFSFHSDINLGDEIIKPKQVHWAVRILLPTHPYSVDFRLAKLCMVFQTATRISAFDNFAWISAVKTKTLRWQIDLNKKIAAQSSLTALNLSVFRKKRGLPREHLYIAYMKCLTTFGLYFCSMANHPSACELHSWRKDGILEPKSMLNNRRFHCFSHNFRER